MLLMSALVLLNSCGIITKTRYGNGLKLNLGERFRKEQGQAGTVRERKKPERRLVFKPVSEEETLSAPQHAPEKAVMAATPSKTVKKLQNFGKAGSIRHHDTRVSAPEKTISKTAQGVQNYRPPIEPNVKIGAILFYGGILTNIFLSGVSSAVAANVLGIIVSIAILLGFILSWIGLSNIRDSGGAFRGKGIAISVIILFILGLIYILLLFLLLIALFG